MPIFSLPNDYGIGSFGKESYAFVDYLKSAGQSVWQVLPLGQTSFGDSPYQTTADVSFNPYFIDLEGLFKDGLLTEKELLSAKSKSKKIDYGKLYASRFPLLKKAFSRFSPTQEFLKVLRGKKYDGYASFMLLKSIYGDLSRFPNEYKHGDKRKLSALKSEHKNEYGFFVFMQFVAEKQYKKLKEYANANGIKILGDLPLYVAYDSADVWTDPKEFMLSHDLTPKAVAGVPPDYFSVDGQLWGNPLYDYDKMKCDGFKWWKSRIRSALSRYDYLRIDHFRGLDRFWAIPIDMPAKDGKWLPAPGREILKNFNNRLIAEDLGVIDDGVRDLLKTCGYPGMKVLLFAFDGNPNNPYLPSNVEKNSVCYVGTHDNDTAYGYAKSLSAEAFKEFKRRLNAALPKGVAPVKTKKDVAAALTELAFSTKSDLAIINFADVIGADNRYRINTPSTIGNWTTRYKKADFTPENASRLKLLAKKYKRLI